MKKTGDIFLLASACLILMGGLSDLILSFVHDIPGTHLLYLNINHSAASSELINLDKALIRAIGGCLVSLGIAAFIITRSINLQERKSYLLLLLLIITLAEGNNALQIFSINSPIFIYPLLCVFLAWTGGILLFLKR
jgi:ABC-type iron transport system FetAB permease component